MKWYKKNDFYVVFFRNKMALVKSWEEVFPWVRSQLAVAV